MSDTGRGPDSGPDPADLDEPTGGETPFDRTRAEYTGVDPDDEFQPVDEVELAEEGMEFDDTEERSRRRAPRDPDELGWDLDQG